MSTSSWSSTEVDDNILPASDPSKKVLKWIAFGLEALGVVLITAITVYLRIADLHPENYELNWKMLCQDITLTEKKVDDDNSIFLYILNLAIPSTFILVGELEYSLFSTKSYFDNMTKLQRVGKNLPRIGRIFVMFLLGVMLSSFTVDYLKIMIVQPRPYFITVYGVNCSKPYDGDKNEEFYDALRSFPSHVAVVAGFSCMFAIGYAHKVHSTSSTPVLMPILSQGFVVLAVTTSLDRYTSHLNHPLDIFAGLLIGILIGLYMSYFVSYLLKPMKAGTARRWPNFLDFMIPRVSLPLTTEALNFSNSGRTLRSVQ